MNDHPLDLVSAAKDYLAIPDETTRGLWPRAAALLGRQGLELGLRRFWVRRAAGLERTPMRCQLLSLPAFLRDQALAARASHAWSALSRACHHHEYELPPTHAELEGWLAETWEVADRIERE